MRTTRIIARAIATKTWRQERQQYANYTLRQAEDRGFNSGLGAFQYFLEHSTDGLSYEVEVGGVHG